MSNFVGIGFNDRLSQLIRALLRPIWLDPVNTALRVNVVTGSGLTVSTVSTVSNQTQLGSVDAKLGVIDIIWHNTWSNAIRSKIT